MSRSGYIEDLDGENQWQWIRYRGAVQSAIRGKRGQEFLRGLLEALDAMEDKRLVSSRDGEIVDEEGDCCALGAYALRHGWDDAREVDSTDHERLASRLGIAPALVREIEYENDDCCWDGPEGRWRWVRKWVADMLGEEVQR